MQYQIEFQGESRLWFVSASNPTMTTGFSTRSRAVEEIAGRLAKPTCIFGFRIVEIPDGLPTAQDLDTVMAEIKAKEDTDGK